MFSFSSIEEIWVTPMMFPFYSINATFSAFRRTRLSKAIENLQNFSLDADPSFRHFQLDVSKELKLLTELNFIQGERGATKEK